MRSIQRDPSGALIYMASADTEERRVELGTELQNIVVTTQRQADVPLSRACSTQTYYIVCSVPSCPGLSIFPLSTFCNTNRLQTDSKSTPRAFTSTLLTVMMAVHRYCPLKQLIAVNDRLSRQDRYHLCAHILYCTHIQFRTQEMLPPTELYQSKPSSSEYPHSSYLSSS